MLSLGNLAASHWVCPLMWGGGEEAKELTMETAPHVVTVGSDVNSTFIPIVGKTSHFLHC